MSAIVHLSETGYYAGRRLCLSRNADERSVHAMYAPLQNPVFRATVCPECLKVWANEAYEAYDEMPDYIKAARS